MYAEFQFHLENQVSKYMQQGLTREAAELRARRNFGALELAKDECRDERAFEPLGQFLRDLRSALRSLRKAPGYRCGYRDSSLGYRGKYRDLQRVRGCGPDRCRITNQIAWSSWRSRIEASSTPSIFPIQTFSIGSVMHAPSSR